MSEKHCPCCENQCTMEHLKCRKGRRYAHEENGVGCEEMDLKQTFMACAHILHHRKGMKQGRGRVFKMLMEQNPISQKELQLALDVKAGSLSELLAKMEHRNWIMRTQDETDHRNRMINLTEEGHEEAQHIQNKEHGKKDPFAILSADEQAQLQTLLNKLLQEWQSETKHGKEKHHHQHHEE